MTEARTHTILLVDDDADNRRIYATILRSAGYVVVEAQTGAEAVPLASRHRPSLVLMDLKMPEMDGWRAMELIRSAPETADVVIVALTIVAAGEDRRNPVRRGFSAHWVKPLAPADLLARVSGLLDDRPA